MASGLLVLDKPRGVTSFDCVKLARRMLGERRVGHCGTLDPLAQGVLVILFGDATRRQREILELDKQYWFRAELGCVTDSGDRGGSIIGIQPFDHITRDTLETSVRTFIGPQWQIPPKISAIRYAGKRLYHWARAGITVPLPPRQISIGSFDLLRYDAPFWEARVTCSRGTYIRSLAADVASQLKSGAVIDQLIRERIGPFRREDALSTDEFQRLPREQLLDKGASLCAVPF